MKPRVDFAKFQETLITKFMNFWCFAHFRKAPIFLKSTSHFHHNFTMLFFNNQIWMNFREKLIKCFTSKLNVINSFVKLFSAISGLMLTIISTIKCLGNPFHNILVSITNFDVSMIVASNIASSRFGIKNTNEKTTFSVNKTSQISQIDFSIHNPPCLRLLNHKLKANLCLR